MTDGELREVYESGMTLRQIQAEMGMPVSTARRSILQAGGTMRPRGSPVSVRRVEIVRLRDEGLSYAEVGRRVGVSRQRVWAVLQICSKSNPSAETRSSGEP